MTYLKRISSPDLDLFLYLFSVCLCIIIFFSAYPMTIAQVNKRKNLISEPRIDLAENPCDIT